MKRKTRTIVAMTMTVLTITMTGCYMRIGDLTIVANRNIDSKTNYQLIERYKTAKTRGTNQDALEQAIDKAVKEVEGGEFLKNVKIYVKNNGRKVKIEGDVWGILAVNTSIETSVTKKIELNTGDKVSFKVTGKLVEGTIIGINKDGAIVEYTNKLRQTKKKQISFDDLTKLEK